MAFLEISGLRKRFGALEILKGIDLTLEKGGFLVLVGPSGCGKSTLLNTIAGLESITSGEIRIGGRVDQRPASLEARHRDGVPVLRALSRTCRSRENMAFGMEMRGVPKPERDKAVAAVAKTLADRASAEAPAEPALRRPAPARRDGPRAGAPAARVPVRRAAVQSRRQAARRHARRDQAPASAARARRSSMSRTTRSRR